jgi:hypothetical protein
MIYPRIVPMEWYFNLILNESAILVMLLTDNNSEIGDAFLSHKYSSSLVPCYNKKMSDKFLKFLFKSFKFDIQRKTSCRSCSLFYR